MVFIDTYLQAYRDTFGNDGGMSAFVNELGKTANATDTVLWDDITKKRVTWARGSGSDIQGKKNCT